jgi:hydroxypyruvate reductase
LQYPTNSAIKKWCHLWHLIYFTYLHVKATNMAKGSRITNQESGTLLSQMHQDAKKVFRTGLQAVSPSKAIRRCCHRKNDQLFIGDQCYNLLDYRRVTVVGAGKATAAMAQVMEEFLDDKIEKGLICVKYGHGAALKKIRTIEAAHPIPDAAGMVASAEIMDMVSQAGEDELVMVLLSGGGSSLLPLPIQGITLEEKQVASNLLIGCGATIHEINSIRKHISAIKGGRLAQAAFPAQVAALMLSDVVGDDLDVIASGPTVPDASTYAQCIKIIDHYGIREQLPVSIVTHLSNGLDGVISETPKPSPKGWRHVHNQVVGSNKDAVAAAQAKAQVLGYHPLILSTCIEGETRTVAQVHTAIAREILKSANPLPAPVCLLSGGETTVTLKGDGLGGRNQEFALAAALDIAAQCHIVVLSGGTDGTDGPTDAAGAIADHTTVQRAAKMGLDCRRHLDNNDAYPLFKALDDLLITGPTQTNVMDLHIILVVALKSRVTAGSQ